MIGLKHQTERQGCIYPRGISSEWMKLWSIEMCAFVFVCAIVLKRPIYTLKGTWMFVFFQTLWVLSHILLSESTYTHSFLFLILNECSQVIFKQNNKILSLLFLIHGYNIPSFHLLVHLCIYKGRCIGRISDTSISQNKIGRICHKSNDMVVYCCRAFVLEDSWLEYVWKC